MSRMGRANRGVVDIGVLHGGVRTLCSLLFASGLLVAAACGAATPKQAGESETPAGAHASDTSSDMSSEPAEASSKPASETTEAPSETDAPAEAPCKYDTSKPIENSMGSIRIAGCISPASVADSIKYKWRSVFECYQDARKADPKAKGTVEIRIGVGMKGVRSVQIPTSEIPSDQFIQCVIDTLRDAPMPKPEQDTAMVIWTAKF